MLNLKDRIEEIRKQPEHIRLRYVWLLVAVSMALVFAVWMVSLGIKNEDETSTEDVLSKKSLMNEFQRQKNNFQGNPVESGNKLK